ncbi:hypothetical protein M8J77_019518 [Diaphorina citri]|nr:hypothetical protein M8J77_019518 [Diaphorina citri]
MYADDLVLLGHSKIDLQKKINVLGEYCLMNELEVNTEKTKIIVFRKGGKLARTDKFYYGQEQLDILDTSTNGTIPHLTPNMFTCDANGSRHHRANPTRSRMTLKRLSGRECYVKNDSQNTVIDCAR